MKHHGVSVFEMFVFWIHSLLSEPRCRACAAPLHLGCGFSNLPSMPGKSAGRVGRLQELAREIRAWEEVRISQTWWGEDWGCCQLSRRNLEGSDHGGVGEAADYVWDNTLRLESKSCSQFHAIALINTLSKVYPWSFCYPTNTQKM